MKQTLYLAISKMELVNIVAAHKFPFTFDLNAIEEKFSSIATRPKDFPAVNLKLHYSDLCQVFRNGNVIILGERTPEKLTNLFKSYTVLLRQLGYPCTGTEVLRIVNMIARYDYGRDIHLSHLATRAKLEYFPELFPAVRYRLNDLKITINIFRTGKCVLLGGKSIELLQTAETRLKKLLNGESDDQSKAPDALWGAAERPFYVGKIDLDT